MPLHRDFYRCKDSRNGRCTSVTIYLCLLLHQTGYTCRGGSSPALIKARVGQGVRKAGFTGGNPLRIFFNGEAYRKVETIWLASPCYNPGSSTSLRLLNSRTSYLWRLLCGSLRKGSTSSHKLQLPLADCLWSLKL